MAGRKAIFSTPMVSSLKEIKGGVEHELGSNRIEVLQELRSGVYLLELKAVEDAERLIADGFEVCNLHVQPSPPVGQFTNIFIMGLRAYVEDDAVIAALSKFGEIKSEVIRLKYKTGHDLAGLQNGNRLVKMVLATASIPYPLKIEGEWCRIIHSNQKPVCNICLEEGHRRSTCPQISCFKCGQAGHIRPNCPNSSQDNDNDHAINESIAEENNDNKDDKDKKPDHEEPAENEDLEDPDDDNYSHSNRNRGEEDTEQSLSIFAQTKVSTSTLKRDRLHVTDSSSEEESRKRRPRLNPQPNVTNSRRKGKSTEDPPHTGI